MVSEIQRRSEKLCTSCDKRHDSSLWYYRQSTTMDCREWLCVDQYLLLEPADRLSWFIPPLDEAGR